MKAFSPAGMAVKAFFGYGAKTFGNPLGSHSGDGGAGVEGSGTAGTGTAWAGAGSTTDGIHANNIPPAPTPPPVPPATLTINITADHNSDGLGAVGVALSSLLTAPQLAAWQAGTYNVLALQGSGAPARGYWILNGDGGGFTQSGPGFAGLVIDVAPSSIHAQVTVDTTLLHIYGGGGTGGNQASAGDGGAGGAGIAITAPNAVDLTVTLSGGGVLFGGGGGGRWGNPVQGGLGGGGGAAGWSAGHGSDGGTAGGVYDSNNGGANNPNVAGGAGGNAFSGTGGGLGAPGTGGDNGQPLTYPNGAAGAAVSRGPLGTTTIVGGTANNLRGAVH